MPRISDSELAANVRQRNRVNSERRRQRLAIAGKVQLLTWIPGTLRRALDSVAAARGEPLSETTTALLLAGLNATTPATLPRGCCWECGALLSAQTAPPDTDSEGCCWECGAVLPWAVSESATTTPDTPEATATTTPASNDTTQPVYTGVVSSRDALMAEVGKLLDEGLSGAEIARQLNASGKRTANGAQFTSANLLRDYRAWAKKTGTADTTRDTTTD